MDKKLLTRGLITLIAIASSIKLLAFLTGRSSHFLYVDMYAICPSFFNPEGISSYFKLTSNTQLETTLFAERMPWLELLLRPFTLLNDGVRTIGKPLYGIVFSLLSSILLFKCSKKAKLSTKTALFVLLLSLTHVSTLHYSIILSPKGLDIIAFLFLSCIFFELKFENFDYTRKTLILIILYSLFSVTTIPFGLILLAILAIKKRKGLPLLAALPLFVVFLDKLFPLVKKGNLSKLPIKEALADYLVHLSGIWIEGIELITLKPWLFAPITFLFAMFIHGIYQLKKDKKNLTMLIFLPPFVFILIEKLTPFEYFKTSYFPHGYLTVLLFIGFSFENFIQRKRVRLLFASGLLVITLLSLSLIRDYEFFFKNQMKFYSLSGLRTYTVDSTFSKLKSLNESIYFNSFNRCYIDPFSRYFNLSNIHNRHFEKIQTPQEDSFYYLIFNDSQEEPSERQFLKKLSKDYEVVEVLKDYNLDFDYTLFHVRRTL